jgi:hypothetical protein
MIYGSALAILAENPNPKIGAENRSRAYKQQINTFENERE